VPLLLTGNSEDVIFVFVSVVDSNGTVVPDADNEVTLGVIGPATVVGPNQFDAEAGIATFLIQTATQPGQITVSATSAGLSGDTDNIISE